MVVMVFPAATEIGVTQERTASPSRWTVQEPQSPAPQPYLVPVSSSVSRKTQSSGVSGATLTLRSVPLTRRVKSDIGIRCLVATASDGNGFGGKRKQIAWPGRQPGF